MHPQHAPDGRPGNATSRARLATLIAALACTLIFAAVAKPEPPAGAPPADDQKAADDFVRRFQRGQRLMGSGHDDEAEKLFRQLISEAPEQASIHHALAVLLTFRKRPAEATPEFVLAAKLAPDDAVIQRDTGLNVLSAGRAEEAERYLAQACRLWPDDVEALIGHGAALRAIGRATLAEAEYRRAVAADANSVDAAVGLAACIVEKKPAEALSLIAAAPGPWPDVLLVRGTALVKLDRCGEAAKELAKILDVAPPGVAGVMFLRGATEQLVLCGDVERADVAAKKWLDVESAAGAPTDAACFFVGEIREAAGDHAGAIAALAKAPKERSARTKLLAAAVFVRAGKKDDAKSALEALVASEKDSFESAAASRLLGKTSEADFAKLVATPGRANDVAWIESLGDETAGDAAAASGARVRAAELSSPPGEFPGLLVRAQSTK